MKRFFMFWFLVGAAIAIATFSANAETVKMSWKQNTADLPFVQEFRIYIGNTPDEAVLLETIPYTGQTSLAMTKQITVTGQPGTTVRKYFSIASVSKNGNVTQRVMGQTIAGQGYLEFIMPPPDVSIPFDVLIEIVRP